MKGPARFVLSVALAVCSTNLAFGQANSQPTPDPVVTAQNEAWYLNGDPVAYGGNLYYPAGPHTYFNRYEMVRSGFVNGIPIYTRTTIEPYSMVFVPIGGGLMQPYERRRSGDVAGTVGSTTPSFPVTRPSEQAAGTTTNVPMAAAPPSLMAGSVWEPSTPVPAPAAERPVGTSGTIVPSPAIDRAPTAARPLPRRPGALNGVFVEFQGEPWVSNGLPVLLGRSTFTQIGEYHGLPVYRRADDQGAIYIPVQRDAELLARYASKPR